MKRTAAIPKGISEPIAPELSLAHPPRDASCPPALYAAPIRRRAKQVLDLPKAGNRLQLILGLMVVIGLGLAVPLILDCLLLMAELMPYLSEGTSSLWLWILYGVILGGVSVFFTLPLLGAVYRMAVLMTKAHQRTESGEMPKTVDVSECLYPFTSTKAYGRTLYVSVCALGSLLLTLLPAALILIVAAWWIPLVSHVVPPIVYVLLWVLHIAVACLAVLGMLRCLSRGMGFGYLVFSRPEVPIRQLREEFRRYHRPPSLPLWLMLGFGGRIALSCVAVFMPLLLHTVPYMLLSWASYGRFLADAPLPASTEPLSTHSIKEDMTDATATDAMASEVLSSENNVTEAS